MEPEIRVEPVVPRDERMNEIVLLGTAKEEVMYDRKQHDEDLVNGRCIPVFAEPYPTAVRSVQAAGLCLVR